MRRTDPLIVGGGPAGSTAAILLARGGARPLLLERHAEPRDALCGGFLSWRTLARLAAIGLDRADLGGEPIARVRLFAGKRAAEARLPGQGLGLSRQRLDAALLDLAQASGARIERGAAARSATSEGRVRLADGGEVAADAIFLATGKYDLRGLGRPRVRHADATMGLRFHFAGSPRLTRVLRGTIEIHMLRGGYAGLLLQEDGSANLCLAVRRERLAETDRDPERLLAALHDEAPLLAERLAGETRIGGSDAIGLVPYGWRATRGTPGIFRLGDQAGVIASLAGEGVGIALASGVAAAERYLTRGPAASVAFQHRFARRARRPIALAQRLKAIAELPPLAAAGVRLASAAPWLVSSLARSTRICDAGH